VDQSFQPAGLGVPSNVLPEVVEQARGLGLAYRLSQSALYRSIAPCAPRLLRRLGRRLALRRARPAAVGASEAKAFLRPQQRLETEELSELLGRGFPEWQTLYAHDEVA
jgi:hypothetical protein